MAEDDVTTTESATTTVEAEPGGTTLTQDEVNRLVGSARVEARTAFLKKHGFKSEEDLQSALKKAKDLEEAQMSELEKAAKRIEELEKAAAEAQAAAESMRLANLRARIGREKGLPEPLIDKLVGNDEEAIGAEVEALLPFIRTTEAEPPNTLGAGSNPAGAGSMSGSPDEKMAAALIKAVRGG